MSTPDGVVLLVLLAFALWGALRGPLRQAVALVLLAAAFVVAGRAHGALVGLVDKVSGLAAEETRALAWGLCFFLALVGGGVLLSMLGDVLGRVRRSGWALRSLGALLGATKGAVVLVLAGYAVLAWQSGAPDAGPGPALRRETPGDPSPQAPGVAWRNAARDTHAARWLVSAGETLGSVLELPPWIEAQRRRVNATLEASP